MKDFKPSHPGSRIVLYWLTVPLTSLVLSASGPAAEPRMPSGPFENLYYFPSDIPAAELLAHMQEFNRVLESDCTYCHVTDEQDPLGRLDYAADDKVQKQTARVMLHVVRGMNAQRRAGSDGGAPVEEASCATCHRP